MDLAIMRSAKRPSLGHIITKSKAINVFTLFLWGVKLPRILLDIHKATIENELGGKNVSHVGRASVAFGKKSGVKLIRSPRRRVGIEQFES